MPVADVEYIFDVRKPTVVDLDTAVELTQLDLVQGEDYHAVVVAMDMSGECLMVTKKFTIDVTPPEEGRMMAGDPNFIDMVQPFVHYQ